jgi:hypothetical protein
MTLTKDDLTKIKAVVDAGSESTKAYVDRRIQQSDQKTDQKIDEVKEELSGKIDEVKTMLEGDYKGVVEDVEDLKPRVAKLESKLADS